MSFEQFKAILQLRWKISRNQWKRAGKINFVLMMILLVTCLAVAVASFFVAAISGYFAAPVLTPARLMLLWDAVVVAFLFFWGLGVVTELQRSQLISLENFLHLPVTLRGAFVLNYLSSLVSPSLIMLLPMSAGFCLAITLQLGIRMLWMIPLTVSFVMMITTVTYQFRGWLAQLMENKRRRGSIIALIIISFVMLAQVPSLFSLSFARQRKNVQGPAQTTEERAAARALREQKAIEYAVLANQVIPPGWHPLGIRAAAEGRWYLSLSCCAGMTLIGAVSLSLSYRSTLRKYQGVESSKPAGEVQVRQTVPMEQTFMARSVPFVSEQQGAMVLMNLKTIMRAPETRLMLLTPVIFSTIYGALLLSGKMQDIPEWARPLPAIGVLGLSAFGFAQMLLNMFSFDRDGFRAYLLIPVERRSILLAKNLAFLPLALGLGLLQLIAMSIVILPHPSHFLATAIQLVTGYLLYCPLGNLISIQFPAPSSIGTGRTVSPKLIPALCQGFGAMFAPIVALPAAMLLGIEVGIETLTGPIPVPVYLILTIAELGLVIWFYRWSLRQLGQLLARRETIILQTITVTP
ncbi:MAG: hypothetical protein JNL58_17820 [Planctomyces sp.]|nr:hypothetical protein [Planctomyces sp.]